MKATTLLKNDHTKVKGIFKEYQSAGERAYKSRAQLFEKMKKELEIHSAIEEEIFYPAVRAARTKKTEEIIEEAFEEHAEAKQLIEEISALRPEQEEFDSKVSELIKAVKHHASEEEAEMFPQAEKHLSGDELEELGQQMEQRKTELTASKRTRTRGVAESQP